MRFLTKEYYVRTLKNSDNEPEVTFVKKSLILESYEKNKKMTTCSQKST